MKESAAKQTIRITAINGLVRGLGLFLRVLLSRTLGPEIMGVTELAQSMHMLVVTPLTSGLPLAVSRMTAKAKKEEREKALAAGVWLVRAASACLIPAFFLFSPLIARASGDVRILPSLWCSVPCVLILGYSAVYNGYLYGVERSLLPAFSELIEQCARIVFCLALLSLLRSLAASWLAAIPAFSTMLAELVGLGYVLWKLKLPLSFSAETLACRKPVVALAAPATLSRMLAMLLHSLESILIPLRLQASGLSPSEATSRFGMIFGMVLPILMLPCVFTNALCMVVLPRVAQAEAEPRKLRRLLLRCFLTATPAAFASAAALWCFAPLLSCRLYRLAELTPLFRAGAPLCVLLAFSHVAGGMLSSLGLQRLSMLGALPVSALTLCLIWLLPALPELRQYGVLLALGTEQFLTLLWNVGALLLHQKNRARSLPKETDKSRLAQ